MAQEEFQLLKRLESEAGPKVVWQFSQIV